MAAVTDIALYNAQATPVLHTFIPQGRSGDTFWWEDQSAVAAIGNSKISIEVRRPKTPRAGETSANRMIRVPFTIAYPVLETLGTADSGLTPPPTVSHILRFNGEFLLPERSTLAQRQHIRKYAEQLIANATLVAATESLLSPY